MKPSSFRFTKPVLTNLNYEFNEQFSPEHLEPEEISTSTRVSVKRLEEPESSAFVSLTIDLPAEKDNSFPFFISATMSARFEWDDTVTQETLEALLTKNAPALLLGYLRPWIAQVTGAGPMSAVHIPFMDFSQEDSE